MSEDSTGQFDGLLLTCLQQSGGITGFFDSIFGFLERKSDFFQDEKGSRNYVDMYYNKWIKKYQEKKEKEKKIRQRREEEERRREEEEKAKKKPKEASTATVKEITPEEYERKMKEEAEKKKQQEAGVAKKEEKKKDDKKEDDGDKLKEGHIMPNKEKGADLEKYSWGQMDIKEITINFRVPEATRGKDLKIECTNTHLYVGIKGQPPIIDSELAAPILSDSLMWHLEDDRQGKLVNISFDKFTPTWWESVEKDCKVLIDSGKVRPEETKVSDIEDPELKAQVEKMMFDTRQKAMGKPTSDILQKAPQLEEFMRKHPEMDFSKVQWN